MPDFESEMAKLVLLVQCAAEMDIDVDFLQETVARAQAIGPFIDPTAFVRGRAFKNLEEQGKLLDFAAPFVRKARQLKAELSTVEG